MFSGLRNNRVTAEVGWGRRLTSKSQIDKIGDRLRNGDIDATALRELEAYRAEFAKAYTAVEQTLRDTLGHEVTGRPSKSTLAIIEKLRRQKSRLTQIQDIAGCRIIVGNILDQDSLVEAARVMLGDVVMDDKRSAPTHGYRAVHLIVHRDGKIVEVQIRTRLQHYWAEISEKLADAYGQEIKYGKGQQWALDFLNDLSRQTALLERLHTRRVKLERVHNPSTKKQRKELERAIRMELYKVRELFNRIKDR